MAVQTRNEENFYPRPPRGGRRFTRSTRRAVGMYFYPRPPRGGRHLQTFRLAQSSYFYPRPPRGGRLYACKSADAFLPFLSTSPARGTTATAMPGGTATKISIHVPREGDDTRIWIDGVNLLYYFYPRPPRGGRHPRQRGRPVTQKFLSTSPARGTTQCQGLLRKNRKNFYPRPPRGGRPGHA